MASAAVCLAIGTVIEVGKKECDKVSKARQQQSSNMGATAQRRLGRCDRGKRDGGTTGGTPRAAHNHKMSKRTHDWL